MSESSKRPTGRNLRLRALLMASAAGVIGFGSFGLADAAAYGSSAHHKVKVVITGPETVSGTLVTKGAHILTVQLGNGQLVTATRNKWTNYRILTMPASANALATGDEVVVAIAARKGRFGHARVVEIIEPYAEGTVLSASSTQIVVQGFAGLERDINVSTTGTAYTEDNTTISSVPVGAKILAWGTAGTDPTELDATNVVVEGPIVSGVVEAYSSGTITLSTRFGTESVSTTSTTIVTRRGAPGSLSHLKPGDRMWAIGTGTSPTTFAASAVNYS